MNIRHFLSSLLLAICLSATAQTNLPPQPAQSSGVIQEFHVTCTKCYVAQNLPAAKIKVNKTKRGLGGDIHSRTLTFHCPKCGAYFDLKNEKWVPDAEELPPKKATNSVPKVKL